MTDFSNVQVGDEVGIRLPWGVPFTDKVIVVTPQFFDVGYRRYRKQDGYEHGQRDPLHKYFVQQVDADFLAEIKEKELKQQRQTLARQLESKLRTLSLEQLKVIEAMTGGEG